MNKYKRRRLILYTSIVILIGMIFTIKGSAKEETIIETYVVKQGDTLWSISQNCKNESDYILDYMDQLKNLNKSDLELLQAGQEILIIKGE